MNESEELKWLESALGEERMKQYKYVLEQWFKFCKPITKTVFESELRKVLTTEEEIRMHNSYMLSEFRRDYVIKVETGIFKHADYTDYVPNPTPEDVPPPELEYRSASSEVFMPDSAFMKMRIMLHIWENKLKGAEEGVSELMVHACQVFVKNIITAMITRKEGYKIRDKKLQCGFGIPIPDPFIRKHSNVANEEPETSEAANVSSFVRTPRVPLEAAEHEAIFAYSCRKRKHSDDKLTVQLLYDTLRENPKIVGLHSVHSLNLLKISLQLDEQ